MSDTHSQSPPPPPPPPPPAATAWHTGLDADIIGHANNKGWKLDDPKEAFAGAVKQARELERHFGVPPDQLLKLPKADAKAEEIAAFRQRLGMPADAKDYDFSTVQDQPLADTLRSVSHQEGLSKDAAAAVAAAVVKHIDSVKTTQATIDTSKIAAEKIALEKNWGGKDSATYQFNHLQAMEGARRTGITPEGVKAMEGQLGYAVTMEHFRKIGANTSEDTFIERGQDGSTGKIVTREGAVARKADLMRDKAWASRYLAGDVECAREMMQLNLMISGEAA